MKKDIIMIVVDKELVDDFHQLFVKFRIQSIRFLFRIIDEDFKIGVFNEAFQFDNNVNIIKNGRRF